jgi:hypothetical protein
MQAKRARRKPLAPSHELGSRFYAQDVLTECAAILVKTGHSPTELEATFREICRQQKEPPRPFDPSSMPYVAGLCHVVAHWYTDPAFLDGSDQPLRLPLRARGPCLAKLIRRVLPHERVEAVTESLIRTGALQRRGRLYAPKDRFVELTQDLSSVHVHGLTSLVGMLRTVQHNISCGDENLRLLERAATNLYVPVRGLPEIHRRIKREVTALLWKLDGYLRSWEVEPGSERTTRVAVGAYASEDPIITGAATAGPDLPPPRPRKGSRRGRTRAARNE